MVRRGDRRHRRRQGQRGAVAAGPDRVRGVPRGGSVNDPRNEWLFDDAGASTSRCPPADAGLPGGGGSRSETWCGSCPVPHRGRPTWSNHPARRHPWGRPVRKLALPRDAALVTILRGPRVIVPGRRTAGGRRRAAVRRGGRGEANCGAAARFPTPCSGYSGWHRHRIRFGRMPWPRGARCGWPAGPSGSRGRVTSAATAVSGHPMAMRATPSQPVWSAS